MKDVIAAVAAHMRARKVAGRNIEVFQDDVLIAAFSHSGSAWFLRLLGGSLFPDGPGGDIVDKRLPDIHRTSQAKLASLPRPRVLASHACFDPRFKRVIYLVRDPRDVFVEWARDRRADLGGGADLEALTTQFLDTGSEAVSGSWAEHVGSWLAPRAGSDQLHLVRYEDLVSEPQRELIASLKYIQREQGFEEIERTLRTAALTTGLKPGTWRSELPASVLNAIEAAWSPLMTRVGYQPSTRAGVTDRLAQQERFWARVSGSPQSGAAVQKRR